MVWAVAGNDVQQHRAEPEPRELRFRDHPILRVDKDVDLLQKPITQAQLSTRIREVLDRR